MIAVLQMGGNYISHLLGDGKLSYVVHDLNTSLKFYIMLQSLIIQMLVLYGQSMASQYNLRYALHELAIA